jgi:ribosomal-protein-alanine N-acetyltransferase
VLRRITKEDQEEFIRLSKESVELHRPWIFSPTTPIMFQTYIQRFNQSTAEGILICIRESGAIAGFVGISDIIRGPYQRATVGYYVFSPSSRQGYMTEGFDLVFRLAFTDLKLHRLEADIQPGNKSSVKLARRVGFRHEGYSPGFVLIDGSWRDHERWAITSDMIPDLPT